VIEPNLDRVWAALMTGARPSRTPFTVLQLATSGIDGAPKVRSVILRGADAERGAVSFFTDVRSTKIEEIRHQPRVSLLGYDADAGFQIRLEGKATIDTVRVAALGVSFTLLAFESRKLGTNFFGRKEAPHFGDKSRKLLAKAG
jgi:pyridoxine/pyridoxamine 5'-phosphate oxidase